MIPLGPVVARSRVKASRIDTWSYLVEADLRSEWWPELRLEPEVGGSVAEQWSEGEGDESVSRDASGTIDVWVEGHAIGFTWREAGDERDTAVLLTLRTQSGGTGITITETGFDALPKPAERAEASQEGWKVLLSDLTAAIDGAVDTGALAAAAVVGGGAAAVGIAAEAAAVEGPATEEPAAEDGAAAAEEAADDAAAEDTGAEGAGADALGADEVDVDDADADAGVPAESAPVGGELDTVPVVLDGEVVEPASEDDEEIVLDPEPQLGDHLELDTGAITIVSDADAEDSSREDALAEEESIVGGDSAVEDSSVENSAVEDSDVENSADENPAEESSADEASDADVQDEESPTADIPSDAEAEAVDAIEDDTVAIEDDTVAIENDAAEIENDAAEIDAAESGAEVAAEAADDDTDTAEATDTAEVTEAAERTKGAAGGEDAGEDSDEDETQTTGDPDFDDLIRGLI